MFSSPSHPDWLWGLPNLLCNGYQGLFPRGQSGRDVKLTTHFQLVPRSWKDESIHPLLICLHGVVLNSLSTGTTLPLPYPIFKNSLCCPYLMWWVELLNRHKGLNVRYDSGKLHLHVTFYIKHILLQNVLKFQENLSSSPSVVSCTETDRLTERLSKLNRCPAGMWMSLKCAQITWKLDNPYTRISGDIHRLEYNNSFHKTQWESMNTSSINQLHDARSFLEV
jgi:hypothetical protein